MADVRRTSTAPPAWITQRVQRRAEGARHVEIETKFVVPKTALSLKDLSVGEQVNVRVLDQVYLNQDIVSSFALELHLDPAVDYCEWRIRQDGDDLQFTAKGAPSKGGTQRIEHNVAIGRKTFDALLAKANDCGSMFRVQKTRWSFIVPFADDVVLVEIDDYHRTGRQEIAYDFVTCEVEVHRSELADILIKGSFFAPDLLFLKEGVNVTGTTEFSNRALAEHGFPVCSFDELRQWLNERAVAEIEEGCQLLRQGAGEIAVQKVKKGLSRIQTGDIFAHKALRLPDASLAQDVLKELAFRIEDSLGRNGQADERVQALDGLGKGWLRDYHEIISWDCYIRLHAKPQIFRPGLGYANTTTRGAHTSDVIASSVQLARQLGLNAELCMAAAALHDIGHPAGGHVGERVIKECSGKVFRHHIFSVSLAEIFGLNLLKEVMQCAQNHKSGGKRLLAEEGQPQEYGILRIADKLSYSPWDMFDSIRNGYLDKELVREASKRTLGRDIFTILGPEPMDWIWTLTNAAVTESAEAHRARFSEKSGEVFAAYKEARTIVFEEVHPQIRWDSLEAQLNMAYEKVALSFPDVDTAAVVAFITDRELTELTRLVESEPANKPLSLQYLEAQGFGFCALIRLLRQLGEGTEKLYY